MTTALATFNQHGPFNLSDTSLTSPLCRQKVQVVVSLAELIQSDPPFFRHASPDILSGLLDCCEHRIDLMDLAPGPGINPELACEGRGIYLGDCYLKGCGSPAQAQRNGFSRDGLPPGWDMRGLDSPFFDFPQDSSTPRVMGALRRNPAILEFLIAATALDDFIKQSGITTFSDLLASGRPIPIAAGTYPEASLHIHNEIREYASRTGLSFSAQVFEPYGCVLLRLPGMIGRESRLPSLRISSSEREKLDQFRGAFTALGRSCRLMLERGWWISKGSAHYQNMHNTHGSEGSLFLDFIDHFPVAYAACELFLRENTPLQESASHMIARGLKHLLAIDLQLTPEDHRNKRGLTHYVPAIEGFFNALFRRPSDDSLGVILTALFLESIEGNGGIELRNSENCLPVLLPIARELVARIPALRLMDDAPIERIFGLCRRLGGIDPNEVFLADNFHAPSRMYFDANDAAKDPALSECTKRTLAGDFADKDDALRNLSAKRSRKLSVREGRSKEFQLLFTEELEEAKRLPAYREDMLTMIEYLSRSHVLSDPEMVSLRQQAEFHKEHGMRFPAVNAVLDIYSQRLALIEKERFMHNQCWPAHPMLAAPLFPSVLKPVISLHDILASYGVKKTLADIFVPYLRHVAQSDPLFVFSVNVYVLACTTPTGHVTKETAHLLTEASIMIRRGSMASPLTWNAPVFWAYLAFINNHSEGWEWALKSADYRDSMNWSGPAISWRIDHTRRVAGSVDDWCKAQKRGSGG